MADRSLRRSSNGSGKPTVIDVVELSGNDERVSREPGAEPVIDRIAGADDIEPIVVRNESQRIGVVEVDPGELGDFIASRTDSGNGDGDGNSGGGRTRRKRTDAGTKRGRRSKKEVPQNVEAVVTMIHTWASVLLKTPELMLDKGEVKTLSDAYSEFCNWHDVPVLTPKRMSEINLIAVACVTYGTRFVAITKRKKQEREEKHFNPQGRSTLRPHVVQ